MVGLVVAAIALVLGLPSCASTFVRSGSEREAAPEKPQDGNVGAGLDSVDGTTTTGAPASTTPPTTTRGAAPGGAAPAGGAPPGFANQRTRADASGLTVTLTVGGDLKYAPAEDISLQLEAKNTTSKPLQYDSNQRSYFLMRPPGGEAGASWRDSDCTPSKLPGEEIAGPPVTIDPGESVTFQAVYPARPGTQDRDRCRKPNGSYEVVARLDWCPPGSVENGVCNPGKVRQVHTDEIAITIG